jgi:hypothetical protein
MKSVKPVESVKRLKSDETVEIGEISETIKAHHGEGMGPDESFRLARNRKRLSHVVSVNGNRDKTSDDRLEPTLSHPCHLKTRLPSKGRAAPGGPKDVADDYDDSPAGQRSGLPAP